MEKTNVYVLKLEHGCYYVGKSSNVNARYQQHLKGTGAVWTKLHRPIKIMVIYKDVSPYFEDAITKEYMSKYGVNKVRGGSYVTEVLSSDVLKSLEKEAKMAQNRCLRCGRKGHFISECYATTDINGKPLPKRVLY